MTEVTCLKLARLQTEKADICRAGQAGNWSVKQLQTSTRRHEVCQTTPNIDKSSCGLSNNSKHRQGVTWSVKQLQTSTRRHVVCQTTPNIDKASRGLSNYSKHRQVVTWSDRQDQTTTSQRLQVTEPHGKGAICSICRRHRSRGGR